MEITILEKPQYTVLYYYRSTTDADKRSVR